MPKHHDKPHHQGEGVKLAGNPEDLINMMIKDATENKWATNEIANQGPKHKQVLSALLLRRLYKLVQTIEKSTGTEFTLQNGFNIDIEREHEEKALPLQLPINVGPALDKEKIVEAISHAPAHELLAYAMCIQVTEWAIKTSSKKESGALEKSVLSKVK